MKARFPRVSGVMCVSGSPASLAALCLFQRKCRGSGTYSVVPNRLNRLHFSSLSSRAVGKCSHAAGMHGWGVRVGPSDQMHLNRGQSPRGGAFSNAWRLGLSQMGEVCSYNAHRTAPHNGIIQPRVLPWGKPVLTPGEQRAGFRTREPMKDAHLPVPSVFLQDVEPNRGPSAP